MSAHIDIEAIRALKAKYFRLLDCKQWDDWQRCFTEDFTAVYEGPHPAIEFSSREELVSSNREILADVPTVHQGHTSEIHVSEDGLTATGIWSMYDRVEFAEGGFEGWGHYHEEYRKLGEEWKISRIHLTRLSIHALDS